MTVRHGSVPALARVRAASSPRVRSRACWARTASGKSTLVALLSGLRAGGRQGGGTVDGTAVRFRGNPRAARTAGVAHGLVGPRRRPAACRCGATSSWAPSPPAGCGRCAGSTSTPHGETTAPGDGAGSASRGWIPTQPASRLQAGERQSLAVARALHFGATALVIDEPTTPMTMARHTLFGQAILAARAPRASPSFVVTNNTRYAHLIGDRFVLLAGGQVAGNLSREDVDADSLTALDGRRRPLGVLTDALTALHPELGER